MDGTREKKVVALTSLVAAVLLTLFKAIVGVATGSLGILSEAAHSGLDSAAALMTYFAVSISAKPADDSHHYGHGKFESFSALFEVVLLLLTCCWIIYRAAYRLAGHRVEVEVNVWSFAVMGIAIVVDITRSQALMRVARRYGSQALEADALHFQSDIYSSLVVIFGLIFTKAGFPVGDPLAALGVSILVMIASVRLAMRSSQVLLDRAPSGVEDHIRKILTSLPRVLEVRKIRVRDAGTQMFVDVTIAVDGHMSLDESHAVADESERQIAAVISNVDVTIHVEPATQALFLNERP
ncbi:MAG: cation diffusion facilitator family transporter [Acidobacteriia bacterium]|nr:cation diffusion facilitator family transporter [Terriglobia bacterium]